MASIAHTTEVARVEDLWPMMDLRFDNWRGPEHLMPDAGMTSEWMEEQVKRASTLELIFGKLVHIKNSFNGGTDDRWLVTLADNSRRRDLLAFEQLRVPEDDDEYPSGSAIELVTLQTREDVRGQGLGKELLDQGLEWIQEVHPDRSLLFLDVVEGNEGAQRFYQDKFGFVERKVHTKHGGWRLLRMERALGEASIEKIRSAA